MRKNNFHILSGGPGVGKTTLLEELGHSGFLTIKEEARSIIKAQLKIGGKGVPWADKELYACLMLKASIGTFKKIMESGVSDPVFFDRGILDTICYMEMEHIPIPDEVRAMASQYAYNNAVFMFPPWKEIYQNDSERKQSWEDALSTFDKMKETYVLYGYNVIEVPKLAVTERRKFIIDQINSINREI